jgi:hypothetical protein
MIFTQKEEEVVLDRGGLVDKLECVRELEAELHGFREVFDLGGVGRRRAAQVGGELCCEAVCEKILDECGNF